jgi:hypothetical protein
MASKDLIAGGLMYTWKGKKIEEESIPVIGNKDES